jgi:hypothetical protein
MLNPCPSVVTDTKPVRKGQLTLEDFAGMKKGTKVWEMKFDGQVACKRTFDKLSSDSNGKIRILYKEDSDISYSYASDMCLIAYENGKWNCVNYIILEPEPAHKFYSFANGVEMHNSEVNRYLGTVKDTLLGGELRSTISSGDTLIVGVVYGTNVSLFVCQKHGYSVVRMTLQELKNWYPNYCRERANKGSGSF